MTRANLWLTVIIVCAPLAAAAQPGGEGGKPDAAATSNPGTAESTPAKPDSPPAEKTTDKVVDRGADLVDKQPTERRFSWQPFGYLRMQYVAVQNDPNVQFIGRDDGFELQNARVGVRGDMQGIAKFVVSFDGAVDERAQNMVQGKLRVGLRDAFADFTVTGDMAARGGYFQTWVDPEALVPDTARQFVDKPIESRGMRSTQGWYTPGLPPGRSLGAALRLDPKTANQAGFEVALQNGADEFSANNDNDKPAASVSVLFRLPHDGFVVASGRWNPRTVGDLPFRQDETDLQASFGAQVNAGVVSLGAGLIGQRTTFESTNGPTQNAFGAHAQLMVQIPSGRPFAVGYRFGILDPSSLIVTDRVMEHTAGAVMAVPEFRMRVQLQFTHVQEQAARELSNDRAQLAAEVSL